MLIETIKTDMITAKKAGDKVKGSLLNTLYAEAVAVGKNKGNRLPTDEETIASIKKFIKGVDESIDAISKSNIERTDYFDLLAEKAILESYLPKQLTREQLYDIITPLIKEGNQMGAVMKWLKENYPGLYDGKTASEIAKNLQ